MKDRVRQGLFGIRYYYIDDNTRIKYTPLSAYMYAKYNLQRKTGLRWKSKASVSVCFYHNLDLAIEELLSRENKEEKEKQYHKCHF